MRITQEHIICYLESRIASYKEYRSKLVEGALKLSSNNPRKQQLLDAAQRFATAIEDSQTKLYELYAQRVAH